MEQYSVFDIFKIGVGPSSSHTMGPWKASLSFKKKIGEGNIKSLHVKLFGSLAKTGRGHGTDIAILLGLSGHDPETIPTEKIDDFIATIYKENRILWAKEEYLPFLPMEQIEFVYEKLPFHPNAMTFIATLKDGSLVEETYYSVGGGFVIQENEETNKKTESIDLPYPIENGEDLITCLVNSNCSISELVMNNELAWRSKEGVEQGLKHIWQTMLGCIYRGCHTGGVLPGGLEVQRRAFDMSLKMMNGLTFESSFEWMDAIKRMPKDFSSVTKWVSCFALAVNEENASFGRVVTAPTNGAAGVIPAVLMYYLCFCDAKENDEIKFLLTAGEIGSLFKKGSTISAALGGCQAEIGVSSAMAAAGLTECMNGSSAQVMMAAEIAMEHHLGLTCDPIKGLVQVPCIERNTMGAIKAITASQIALSSDPDKAKVSLDNIIKTMWETALDMNEKYKETADGGLAVNVSVVIPEC